MTNITKIKAREILDSRGNPTVEVELFTERTHQIASVPSGASTGKHEAVEVRDKSKRYHGKGVQKAINNVQKKIFPIIKNIDCKKQKLIDELILKEDNTSNKSKFGANAILAVSLASAKAAAVESNLYLYEYLSKLTKRKPSLPRLFFNILNGGKHADNSLAIQEFMISPRFRSSKKNIRAASEIYHQLKKTLKKKKLSTNVGDEGGFAPNIRTTKEALTLLTQAINKAGYKNKCDLALDAAASEFYKKGKYTVDNKQLTKDKLINYYLNLIKQFPIISIEDPFQQEDFKSFAELKKLSKIQIVGDDLTVTNQLRIRKAIGNKSCSCLLLKVNQIGTLTEALKAASLALNNNWQIMVSHRSGETEDTFIADLAVSLGSQLKAGAPCRGERTAKYNRLIRIEEILNKPF